MIYESPECGEPERAALERIRRCWKDLQYYVSNDQRRWLGSVRRVLAARANQGSNSIEGYNISTEDAIAALQGAVEPGDSAWEDWQANSGYRRAMTYVLQLARDPHFAHDPALLRSLHFMMVEYDPTATPGLWRSGPIWITNTASGDVVYEGPDPGYVPSLVGELVDALNDEAGDVDAIVRAAMAHLNFTLIHPFKDGNGRMARCLQSLVLVREGHLAREFCSIEEFLGVPANQQRYYDELARVAHGQWTPERDARSWVRFCMEAHYIQALSVLRRVRESETIWSDLDRFVEEFGFNQRAADALFDASLGLKIRNASYRASLASWGEAISSQTATTDLRAMVSAGLLVQEGSKRGAYYRASDRLLDVRRSARANRTPITAEGLFDLIPVAEPEPYPAPANEQDPLF